MPSCDTSQDSCQLRGQSCYVEVALGDSRHKLPSDKSDSSQMASDTSSLVERTFVYPPEAVLVPLVHPAFCRPSLKRYTVTVFLIF